MHIRSIINQNERWEDAFTSFLLWFFLMISFSKLTQEKTNRKEKRRSRILKNYFMYFERDNYLIVRARSVCGSSIQENKKPIYHMTSISGLYYAVCTQIYMCESECVSGGRGVYFSMSNCIFACVWPTCLSACLSVCPSVSQSVCLSLCVPVTLSVCLSVW